MPVFPNHPIYISVDLMNEMGPSTPFNADGSRDYTYNYMVRVRLPVTEVEACAAPGIPLPFSIHPKDLAALCVQHSAKKQDNEDWGIWVVTVRFSTRLPPGGPPSTGGQGEFNGPDQSKGGQNNPEWEPPEIEWDSDTITRPMPNGKDLGDEPLGQPPKAFLNAAGQPFTPPPVFEFMVPVLAITRNELGFNHKTAAQYGFAVNKDEFLGYPPKTVQCMPPKAKRAYRGNIAYWRVSYRLRFGIMGDNGKPIPWEPVEILNQGLMELKKFPLVAVPKLVPITVAGRPISQPVLLDLDGKKLELVKKVVPGVGGPVDKFVMEPTFIKFRIRPALSFEDLIKLGLGGIL